MQTIRDDLRNRAAIEFDEASKLAELSGLWLEQVSAYHYTLSLPCGSANDWLIDLFPGNQRILNPEDRDGCRGRGPYIYVESPWGLLDVVGAAIERIG